MPRRRLVLAAALLFVAVARPAPDAADTKEPDAAAESAAARDRGKLQGRWGVVREIVLNTVQKGDRGGWSFDGDAVRTRGGIAGTFTLDAAARPKRLVCAFPDGAGGKRTAVYLSAFDDDQLLLAARFFDKDRAEPPLDFNGAAIFFRLARRGG